MDEYTFHVVITLKDGRTFWVRHPDGPFSKVKAATHTELENFGGAAQVRTAYAETVGGFFLYGVDGEGVEHGAAFDWGS